MTDLETLTRNMVFKELQQFNEMNYHDPLVAAGIMAMALTVLADIQYVHNSYDGDCRYDYDPEPYLEVEWWEINNPVKSPDKFRVRFEPLRVVEMEDDDDDPIAAYDRAMGIL